MSDLDGLYELGDVVYYYDNWFEVCGIGIVMGVEDITKRGKVLSYKVYDTNNEISVGEYDNSNFISVKSSLMSPIECYNNFEEFLKSRGVS